MDDDRQRLQKILSSCGIASRRRAEEIIAAGRVRVNGIVATLGQSADIANDTIELDGKPLEKRQPCVYIMLNKPQGCLTTVSDDRGRPTVMELVSDVGVRVYPVGRLDMDSEGLLLLTNDGEFAQSVAHPSSGKTKTYDVQVEGNVAGAMRILRRPMMIDGRKVRAIEAKINSVTADRTIIRITISEGRNRQVRKMCSAAGLRVVSLKRVAIGSLKLGTLAPGKWRHLTGDEVFNLLV